MSTVWLGLGSNMGDREAHIFSALDALRALLDELEYAPIYETEAQDYKNQDDFLNTVARGHTDIDPHDFLERTQKIESEGGRVRNGIPKGPRSIDIDILLWDDALIDQSANGRDLIIPHPSMHQRLFVLKPLLDLDSEAVDPRDGVHWSTKASRLHSQRVMLYRI